METNMSVPPCDGETDEEKREANAEALQEQIEKLVRGEEEAEKPTNLRDIIKQRMKEQGEGPGGADEDSEARS
jgi:hypothetical protein